MTDTNTDSFTDVPPVVAINGARVQLRPMAALSWNRISKAKDLYAEGGDTAICLAYVLLHSRPAADASRLTLNDESYKAALDTLALDVTLPDLQAVAEYLGRLFKRYEEAQVEAADAPGKE